ncbi:MAG TPA: TIGR00730 family Rossman fold protein [Gemmatimonadaceae bacterium]
MTEPIHSICVFCGSANGVAEQFVTAARTFAHECVRRGIRLVYGGASVGLMGALADAALEAGGEVIGVMPRALVDREIAHRSLTTLHIVESMHARKALMAQLADAFVALPGGLGTLEELFEVWTWRQLGIHAKPCGVLNVAEFYTPLISFLDHARDEGFVRRAQRESLVVADDSARLIESLTASSG